MDNLIITNNRQDVEIFKNMNDYLEHISLTKSVTTFKSYQGKLKVFVAWYKVTPITSKIKIHLEKYRDYINSKYSTAKSKNFYISVIRSFYKWLHENDYIEYDPTAKLKNFKQSETHSRVGLSKYQEHDLLEHIASATGCNADRNRVIILLALQNGLRVSEIANVKLEDISLREDDHVIYLLRKGYEDKSCYTILQPRTYNLLMEFIGNRTEGYMFQSYRTKDKIVTESMSRIIKSVLVDAGIDDARITPHSLRNTCATNAYKNGADVFEIMRMLNHANVSTTQLYIKSISRHEHAAEKKVHFEW